MRLDASANCDGEEIHPEQTSRSEELLLLFLLVVCFVFLLDLLLFLQGDLRNTNFGHAQNDGLIGPFVQVLETFDAFGTGHDVSRLNGPCSYL